MKKYFLTLCFLCLLFNTVTLAQERPNNLKINLLSPVVRTFSIFYERAITKDKSAQLGFFYTDVKLSSFNISGLGITPEFRFYLANSKENSTKQAPEGFYLAPFVRFQRFTISDDQIDAQTGFASRAKLNTLGGGLCVGYQFLSQKGITVDLFAGPSYNAGTIRAEVGNIGTLPFSAGFSGPGLRFGVCLGYAF